MAATPRYGTRVRLRGDDTYGGRTGVVVDVKRGATPAVRVVKVKLDRPVRIEMFGTTVARGSIWTYATSVEAM